MSRSSTSTTCVVFLGCLLLLSIVSVNGFFFDKLERLKRLPGLSSLFPGSLSNGVRVCINFNSNYQPGYQQNTCFVCDAYRFTQIATYCTGQSSIPVNINYTQANCIMNQCQPSNSYGNRPMIGGTGVGGIGSTSNGVGGIGGSNGANSFNYPFANNYIN